MYKHGTFGYDREFLEKYVRVVVLERGDSKLVVSPDLQGRIITSTSGGQEGRSFGWINYELLNSGKFVPHCNNFGGEDRFWIGPEGGQYSVFFKKGDPFDLDHWQTPTGIDTEKWQLADLSENHAFLSREMKLKNFSGFEFELLAEREVYLLDPVSIASDLGVKLDDSINSVGFRSVNKLTNCSTVDWRRENGLLSIWILGQFIPSEKNTVIIPVNHEGEGPIVHDSYFGKIDESRLRITENAVFFKGDGRRRGKIGISPERAKPVIGSYDPDNRVLTIVKYSLEPGNTDYVNSMWEFQEDPYSGDVANAYNDGPLPDGSIMGPFFELESSSPAACLRAGETLVHEHSSFHFTGSYDQVNKLALKILGVNLENCF